MSTEVKEGINQIKQQEINRKTVLFISYIVQMLTPEKIFRHIYAESLDASYNNVHLVIVLPDNSADNLEDLVNAVKTDYLRCPGFTFSIHGSKEINEYLNHHHVFYTSACIEDNIVYAHNKMSNL